MGSFVESVKYEADISDITQKINKIDAEQSGLEQSTKDSTGKSSSHWSKFSGGLGAVGGVAKTVAGGLLGVGGAAVAFGPQLLTASASMEALGVKSEIVFGDALADVTAWAEGAAGSMGLTTLQATGLAAGIGDLLIPMGFTRTEAAGMATDLTDLSGALSAWSGGTVTATEVTDILTAALLGETDGLKGLGISISAADVQARLAKKGQEDLTGAALEQAEALAIQELILEKSTDAQAAWKDGSMDSVIAQNEAKASLEQLKETIVQAITPALEALVPIITDVATWLGENLPGALETLKGIFETVIDGGKLLIENLADTFNTSGDTILLVLGGIGLALAAVALAWNMGPGLIITAVIALGAAFLYAYSEVEWFRETVDSSMAAAKVAISGLIVVGKALWNTFELIWDKTEGVRDAFANTLGPAIRSITTFVGTLVNTLQTAVGLMDRLKGMVPGGKGLPFGIGSGIAGVFHEGGQVPGAAGADVPIIARAGEWVLTEEQMAAVLGGPTVRTGGNSRSVRSMIAGGSGGAVHVTNLVTVTAPEGTDPDEFGNVIVEAIARHERINGPVWERVA